MSKWICRGRRAALMLAAVVAVTLASASTAPSRAADKPYHRDDLAEAAVRLEASLRAHPPTTPTTSKPAARTPARPGATAATPLAALRSDADKAAARNDAVALASLTGAIAALAPDDAANWLRLAKATLAVVTTAAPPLSYADRQEALQHAGAAAYLAYQRARPGGPQSGTLEPDALAVIGTSFAAQPQWRPALDALHASLDLREVLEVRDQYDQMRAEHGFRLVDYTVDSDSATPRACFQFSEPLPAGNSDFLPFVTVSGQDKPALSAEDHQLCVEGLQRGERYHITVRAGLPSTVNENLENSAEYTVYVRDRSPSVRFTTRAYVLPRSGQRGIPLVSVNTAAIALKVYRIGDRNLLSAVAGDNFQHALGDFQFQELANQTGTLVWSGELTAETPPNTEVTTAFPVDEALGTLAPGVYVMSAQPTAVKHSDGDWADALATQWFIVSDLGITAVSAADGVHVFVNSLATTDAVAGTQVRLVARNNEVLATATTDAAGQARFDAAVTRGEGGMAPALVVATGAHDDYAFLSLMGPAFDFSDRGVGGRAAPPALDAFVYAERGVYRSGETVHLTALLRTAAGSAGGAPLTVVVERPDGVEYRRAVLPDQGAGGRSLDVALASTAATGTWSVKAYADPKRPAIGATTFLVEDYMPDRTEFTLVSAAAAVARGKPVEVAVDGRFLYGAPASDMELSGSVRVEPARGRPGYDGWQFGVAPDQGTGTLDTPLDSLPATDRAGKARFNVTIDKLPEITGPLQAQVMIAMAESGGRAVERRLTLPIVPATAMIGVKPRFAGGELRESDTASFDAVVVAPDGAATPAQGLRWQLMRLEHRYQWYQHRGVWSFEAVQQTRRVAGGSLDVTDQAGRIATAVEWGRYRLEVSAPDGSMPMTAVSFDAGFFGDDTADTPDLLETALDKDEYAAGDTMTVAVTARTAGAVRLAVLTDHLAATVTEKVRPGVNRIRVPVGRDWGNGGYVVATLLRPLDEAARRMPGRAIGVRWFGVDRNARTLAVTMTPEPVMRPGGKLRVPVRIDGLGGEEARVVVAAVDVGILNLTGYKPPVPEDFYFGQRRLAAEVRDLYGQLIDGMQASRGHIRSGGDALGRFAPRPPSGPPLALYSGIVAVAADGTAEVSFDIPAFTGTVRLMAVAWSAGRIGHGSTDVTVRDPVVATVTLPRFVLTGDRSTLQVEVDNVEGPPGDYQVEVAASGPVSIATAPTTTVRLGAHERRAVAIPLAAEAAGDAGFTLKLAGPGGFELARSYHLAARPATDTVTRRTVRSLAAGESLTLTPDLFADFVPGTGSVALSAGPSVALDAAALLQALERYPYACSEQLTSRTLPLLYAGELAAAGKRDAGADATRIRDAVERLLTRQDSTGGFGLWSPGSDDPWLDSYVVEFLTRARERGVAVPDAAFRLALDRVRNFVVNATEPVRDRDGGRAVAYGIYVLARNGIAPLGDLRYLADAKLADIPTPLARAQIGAALAITGDRVRAERVFAATFAVPPPSRWDGSLDYGSRLRDAAAAATLQAENGAAAEQVAAALREVEAARAPVRFTSTQEDAWMVMAAHAAGRDRALSLDAGGEAVTGALYRTLAASELVARPFKLTNTGRDPVRAVVAVSGAPVIPEPAAANGFKLERRWYGLDGKPADPARARQNQRLVVVLEVTEQAPQWGHVMVSDYLPAGFEIDNPRLVSSGSTKTLAWITNAAEPAHSEFRDDHFAAAFDRTTQSPSTFTVAYVVRVVSPGTYMVPEARVEDMYQPERWGHTATGTVTVTAAR